MRFVPADSALRTTRFLVVELWDPFSNFSFVYLLYVSQPFDVIKEAVSLTYTTSNSAERGQGEWGAGWGGGGQTDRQRQRQRDRKTETVSETGMLLLVACLTSQQHASVSQGRICSDNFTCCHTEMEAADQTFHLSQSQYTDTGPTSPSADPVTPGAWQGSHWSANF